MNTFREMSPGFDEQTYIMAKSFNLLKNVSATHGSNIAFWATPQTRREAPPVSSHTLRR
jgi:hypothetical protein